MNPRRTSSAALAALAAVTTIGFGACTRYGEPEAVYGDRHEVQRRLVGAPMVEEVTSANVTLGGAGAAYGGTARGFAAGGLSTVKRTHCVQQAEVDYSEPVDYISHVEHRAGDLVPSSIILGVGLLTLLAVQSAYQRDLDNHAFDPTYFRQPEQPTGAYAVGAAIAIAGGAWLTYALTALPKGPPPTRASSQHTWTETTYVEAQGCGVN